MGDSPKTPTEDPASIALRKRQAEQLLQLDEDANTRIKRMFTASQGLRIGRGLADSRLPAGDSTRGAGPADYGVKMSKKPGYTTRSPLSRKRKQGRGPGFGPVFGDQPRKP